MTGLARTYLVPGGRRRRAQAREEVARMRALAAAERDRRRVQEQVNRELEEEQNTAARVGRSPYRAVRAALWRGRAALRPVWALAALTAAGWAVWGSQVHPVVVAVVWAVVGWGWWRLRLARRLDRDVERHYAAGCFGAAGVWLVSCALTSPGDRGWMLLWGWIVAALIWWGPGRHWPSDWQPEEEEIVHEIAEHPLAREWAEFVGAPAKSLPGSRVTDVAVDEHGARVLQVELVRGQQTVDTATLALDRIASGMEVPNDQLIVEAAPPAVNPTRKPARVQVKLLPDSPLNQIMWFERPVFVDGKIGLGSFVDGIGEATQTVYGRNGRMRSSMTFAGSGFGKSRKADVKAVTMRSPEWQARYPTVIVYIDGQNGNSSPYLWKHATLRGGPDDAEEILAGLLRVGKARQDWNVYYEQPGFFPGQSPAPGVPGLPGIYVFVDEQHDIFTKDTAPYWAKVARELGKVGECLDGYDQVTDLEAFGHNEALRSSMLAGNGFAMHIASRTAGNLVPGLTVDPYKLPAIPGYTVKLATTGSTERAAPLQMRYMPDRQAIDDGLVLPDGILTVEQWYERGADAELDEMSARAFGPVFLERDARKARQREQLAAAIEGREVITVTGPRPVPSQRAAAVDDDTIATATAKVLPLAAKQKSRDELIAIGRQALGLPAAASTKSAAGEFDHRVRDELGRPRAKETAASTREVVRDYLREHQRAKRVDIIAHVEATIRTSDSAVKQALRRLADDGEVESIPGDDGRPGVYVWLSEAV